MTRIFQKASYKRNRHDKLLNDGYNAWFYRINFKQKILYNFSLMPSLVSYVEFFLYAVKLYSKSTVVHFYKRIYTANMQRNINILLSIFPTK